MRMRAGGCDSAGEVNMRNGIWMEIVNMIKIKYVIIKQCAFTVRTERIGSFDDKHEAEELLAGMKIIDEDEYIDSYCNIFKIVKEIA